MTVDLKTIALAVTVIPVIKDLHLKIAGKERDGNLTPERIKRKGKRKG